MRTSQLERALRRHRDIRPHFMGVFASNHLPRRIRPCNKTRVLIANTDPAWKPGRHWVAYCFMPHNGPVYYFDAYGLPPWTPALRRLLTLRRVCRVFGRRIQGAGRTCGYYCLYFILTMLLPQAGYSFDIFGDDLNANDRLVRRIVAQHFQIV